MPLFIEIESLKASIKVFEQISAEGFAAKYANTQPILHKNKALGSLSGDWKMPPNSMGRQQDAQKESKKDVVATAATELLRAKYPQTSTALLDGMRSRGVEIGGSDELANLSAYMSKARVFVHRRKLGGWFLKDQIQEEENPQAEGTGGSRDMGQSSV